MGAANPGTASFTTPTAESQEKSNTEPRSDKDAVWTYRGYRIHASEFNTAMVHLYRGEVNRSNVWRQRLDATTNWAVVTTGATITFAFNQSLGHHSVILLNTLLVTLFLYIESRRYRYYELWTSRVRLMETDFFAAMLVPPFCPAADWAEGLANSLLQPNYPISMWEAFGRRFRRNYFWIYIILAMAWVARVGLLPAPVASFAKFFDRAGIGFFGGQVVLAAGALFYGLLFLIGLFTIGLHQTTGEILPQYLTHEPEGGSEPSLNPMAILRSARRRPQLMAHIVTDRDEQVARHVMDEMQRGCTSLPGKGMYTGETHSVLMVALTATEVENLKKVVSEQDPKAFVIVSPVSEVLGEGFVPLQSNGNRRSSR